MNIELERKKIIEELPYVTEEWKLKAIQKLLDIEEETEEDDEEEYEEEEREEVKPKKKSNGIATVSWDDIEEKLSQKK